MHKIAKFVISLAGVMLLSACGTTSQVIKLSPNTYFISASNGLFKKGASSVKNYLLERSQMYCSEKNKKMHKVSMHNSVNQFGQNGKGATLTFKCQ